MKKYKTVILYKLGRFQEDFEYLFPKIKIKNYIVDDQTKFHKNRICLRLKDVDPKTKTMIVICDRKNKETTKKFHKMGFVEFENFMYLEDFGEFLNDGINLEQRKLLRLVRKYNIDINCYKTFNSEMFKKMIYTDSHHNLNCKEAFRTVTIANDGWLYPCCQGPVEEPLGTLLIGGANKVWNSTRARLFQLSIINKTYTFCNLSLCKLDETNLDKESERINNMQSYDIPDSTIIAFDKTCNFNCKSCRTCLINENNNKKKTQLYNNITKKLYKDKWLSRTKQLVLATQGEVLYSNAYKKILFSNKLKGLELITIYTNGALLNKSTFDKIYRNLKKNEVKNIGFNISVDSIEEETYQTLRPNGNLKALKNNLENLSKEKKNNKISWVSVVFVLQRANYKELPKLVKYVSDLGFERLEVLKIFNWGTYTKDEFKNISMFDEFDNPLPELEEVLNDPIFKSVNIVLGGNVFKNETYGD